MVISLYSIVFSSDNLTLNQHVTTITRECSGCWDVSVFTLTDIFNTVDTTSEDWSGPKYKSAFFFFTIVFKRLNWTFFVS